jgi:hypothetical protein
MHSGCDPHGSRLCAAFDRYGFFNDIPLAGFRSLIQGTSTGEVEAMLNKPNATIEDLLRCPNIAQNSEPRITNSLPGLSIEKVCVR